MDNLSLLSASHTPVPSSPHKSTLETFENSHPGRDYVIKFDCPEFTSLCPITGQPDFGQITIEYTPDHRCVESKSLKIYLFSFRNHGSFHEQVANQILDDLVATCEPRWAKVSGIFRPRGGIAIHVFAEHGIRQ